MIKREQLELMKERAVLVDVSIDQGGCFETSRPTTHSDPTYEVDGITHYCVANMPGAVPITSTYALTNATLPYVLALADHGVRGALARDPGLRPGVNVAGGSVTHAAVAEGTGPGLHARWRRYSNRKSRALTEEIAMATAEKTKLQNFIGGEFVDPADGATEAVLNPATAEEIAEAPLSGEEDVDRAVAAAKGAFDGWADTTPGERALALLQARRRDRGARRRARRPRVRQRRQAAAGVPRRRDARRWPTSCASSPAPRAAWRARPPASTWRATRR